MLDKYIVVCYTVDDVVLLHTLCVLALCSVCSVLSLFVSYIIIVVLLFSSSVCLFSCLFVSLLFLSVLLAASCCLLLYIKAPLPLYHTAGFLSTPNQEKIFYFFSHKPIDTSQILWYNEGEKVYYYYYLTAAAYFPRRHQFHYSTLRTSSQ